jgi:hypothetical protein
MNINPIIHLARQKYTHLEVLYKANPFYVGAVENRALALIIWPVTPIWLV